MTRAVAPPRRWPRARAGGSACVILRTVPALVDLLRSPIAIALLAGAVLALAAAVVLVRRRRSARPIVFLPTAAPIPQSPEPGTPGADVIRMFGPLRVGHSVEGFHISAIYDADDGCIPVLLEGAKGVRFRVDVLRRSDDDPSPPASTPMLALYLCGMPRGSPSPEACIQAIRALAAALCDAAAEPPEWLLSMQQRAMLLEKRRPRDS